MDQPAHVSPTHWEACVRLWVGSLAIGLVLYLLCKLRSKRQAPADPTTQPKPEQPESTLPLLKNTLDFLRHEGRIHDWISAQYILKNQFWSFGKGAEFYENVREFMGDGIFAVDGAFWSRKRKAASHLFTMRELRDSMAVRIQHHTEALCRVLEKYATEQTQFDHYRLLSKSTMGTFCDMGFGVDISCLDQVDEHPFQVAFDRVQQAVRLRVTRPHWLWKLQRLLDIGAERALLEGMPIIDRMIYSIAYELLLRRHTKQPHSDGRNAPEKLDVVSLFLDRVVEFTELQST